MTVYNILFPFLILLALGIVVFILTRHLPEAQEHRIASVKEEKKRWWQVALGKGEGLLRKLRVLILKIDKKLSESIKTVREKKEKMGESIRDYKEKYRQKGQARRTYKSQGENLLEDAQDDLKLTKEEPGEIYEESEITQEKPGEGTSNELKEEYEIGSGSKSQKRKPISILGNFRNINKGLAGKKSKAVEEVIKKTFTPLEIKVETRQYWKKKEEMLIQTIVREPKNINLFLQLGRLYTNQHNWEDAQNAFLEVLKLDKTNVKAKEELKRIENLKSSG